MGDGLDGRRAVRRLSHDDPPKPAATLRALADFADDVETDWYMSGVLFDRLEGRIRDLLGKESVIFSPSGKLAQMAALRAWTGRAGCGRVAMHPRSHFEEYEARAYQELWGLSAASLGGFDRLPTAADLAAIREPLGAVTLELPLRRLGCQLPSWEDLVAISEGAAERGVARHLDGARLWESQPFYDRPLAEIAALFDSVYVAFDKGLGGLSGAALAGPRWLIEEVGIWQRRAGGRALRSFPTLLAALKGLDERLEIMPLFHQTACRLAVVIGDIAGVSVSPSPPHANAFLVTLEGNPAKMNDARDRVCEEQGLWLFNDAVDCVEQGRARFEVTVRGAALELSDGEVRRAVERLRDLVT